MNYAAIRNQFLQILNRSDCTTALADDFIEQGIQRSQRLLSLTSQERIDNVAVGAVFTGIDIPSDFIRPVAVYMQDQGDGSDRKLRRVSLAQFLETPATGGRPLVWVKDGVQIKVRPAPAQGDTLKLLYQGEFETFTDDSTETTLSAISPQLFIYGGLVFAAPFFLDDRAQQFEVIYQNTVAELQAQSDMEELSGGAVIQPAYSFPYDGDY